MSNPDDEKHVNALWHGGRSRKIKRRIIVEADLVLDTPAHFGSGDEIGDDDTDMVLLKATDDDKTPLLTGASLAGALRGYLLAYVAGYRKSEKEAKKEDKEKEKDEKVAKYVSDLFGVTKGEEEGLQSALIVDDAYGKLPDEGQAVVRRDGVSIDSETGTAKTGALYDVEAWAAGTTFPVRLELLITEKEDEQKLRQAFDIALQGLSDNSLTLGARKNRGFGRFTMSKWRVWNYDMHKPVDLVAWLQCNREPKTLEKTPTFANDPLKKDKRIWFTMTAEFSLNGSLLVRSYGTEVGQPDSVHIRNGKDKPILPGTSVAGALRGRAKRILNVLHDNDDTKVRHHLNDLFGDDNMKSEKAKASRLIVEEHEITEGVVDLVQNRVAIDRFTGGAKDTALLSEQPVFGKKGTIVKLGFTIREPENRDMGLLLLLLKDLWTSDLSLGGGSSIGRGRLSGNKACFEWKQAGQDVKPWSIETNKDGSLSISSMRDEMEQWARAVRDE